MSGDQDETKWMSWFVDAVEIPCWVGIVILSIIAGTFNFTLAVIAGVTVVAAAGFIWWRVRHELRSIKDHRNRSDPNAVPKK